MSRFRVETMPAGVPGPAGAGEVVHLVMDDPARAANVLDGPALDDLDAALAELEARPGLGGVVVRSGKRGSFVTGADVEALGPATDRAEVGSAIRRAQQVLARLAALPCPTVAAIDGLCLGGGAELALACGSRIASDEPHTRIGLPDVLLGFLPAFGGTTRLARLVGTRAALDLILTGRALDARQAERVGLVARAVPGAWLIEHAHRRLAELAADAAGRPRGAGPARDRWRPRGLGAWLADGTVAGRGLAFSRARARTRALTRGEYPAPVAALGVLQHAAGLPTEAALRLEAEWASDLAVGPVCRNLLRAFRLAGPTPWTHASRGRPAGVDSAGGGDAPVVERLQVVGAGTMGTALAEVASGCGIEVRLRDADPAALARSLRILRAQIADRTTGSRLAPHEAEAQLARIHPGLEPAGLQRADLAIETVVEDLDVKRRVLAELEVRMSPQAVLATGTATLAVEELAAGLGHPERFVGLHFLHALQRRHLVEVVRGARTSEAALATAVALVRRLGRIPVVVKDAPGFVVNRVLASGLREALHLLDDGYRVADVDRALRGFGMALGPFETMDEMGLDRVARLTAALARAFPERFAPAPQLEALTTGGRLGREGTGVPGYPRGAWVRSVGPERGSGAWVRSVGPERGSGAWVRSAGPERGSGAGFYRYRRGRRTPDPQAVRLAGAVPRRRPVHLEALAERVTLAMVNEAACCLADAVVTDAGTLDLALLHGADFPRFRGGPLRYADAMGLARVEARLNALRAENGERFRPSPLIVQLVAAGGTFTGPPAG